MSASLPTAWSDYQSFKYTADKWGNILIFDTSGEMVGQINYWSHVDQWDRSWDDEYPSQIHTNKNFHFQGMEVTDEATGNWHWVSIGHYQVGKDELVDPAGDITPERSWENVGQTMYARMSEGDDPAGAMNSTIHDASLPEAESTNQTKISGWEDVDRIEVSSNTYTHEELPWRDKEVEESTEVRFYEEVSMDNGNWYHTKFLGSMEKRDGFIEIRDENWETVARIADLNGSDMLSWDELQVAEDAAGNLLYPGILEAWTNVSSFFPEVATFDDEYTSDSSEGDHSDGSDDGPQPEDIGIGTNAAFAFDQTMLEAWGAANASRITAHAPESTWGDTVTKAGITEAITVLQYEFGYAVMETIAMGVPSEPANGDNNVTFISSQTGLAVLLDVSEGITVSGTGDDLIYSGNVTSITVRPETMAGDYLTATGLTGLTLENDIASIMMDGGDDDASQSGTPVSPSEANVTWSPNPLIDPTTLTFTSDEEHIYAFTSTGEMVGQINFHTDEMSGHVSSMSTVQR